MPSLSETQARVRDAVVAGARAGVSSLLVGGGDPGARLEIHRRHYHASLIDTLRTRFPATAWLVGDAAVVRAAEAFVVDHPPRVFCMAEFGEAFPAYLAQRPWLNALPCLGAFAQLEWEMGRVSLAISQPPLDVAWLQGQDPDTLGASGLRLQPGLAWCHAAWAVHALMQVYLAGDPPSAFTLAEGDTWVEVHGRRGELTLTALARGAWHFRRALAAGQSIEAAAVVALDADPQFEPGGALVHLFVDGLVTGRRPLFQE